MAESTIVRVKRDGSILIAASGGTPNYTVAYEVGDFSFDVPLETVNHFPDRGAILATPSIRKGDDQPMSISFSAYMRDIGDTASGYATLLDIAIRYASKYVASNWTSTMGTNGDVDTVTVTLTVEGSDFGESDKSLAFPFVVLRGGGSEGDPNNVPITGTSWALRPTLA